MRHQRRLKTGAYQRASKQVTLAEVPSWDMGATGRANRHGLIQEDATELDPETGKPQPNPNGVKRMRRVDMLEVWFKRGTLTAAQYNAAFDLRSAFDRTQMTPSMDPSQDKVDSSPKPDHAVTIHIDRLSRFHELFKLVASEDRQIIDVCILQGSSPAKLRLRDGRRPYYGPGHAEGLRHLVAALERLASAMGH